MNIQDIEQAFANTLILYKGKPFYCQGARDARFISVMDLQTKESSFVSFSLAFVKPPPGRIGYINTPVGCAYVSRIPKRQWKIGLCKSNMHLKIHQMNRGSDLYEDIRRELGNCYSEYFTDAILGVYPSIDEAISTYIRERRSVAFDRMFCITRAGEVEFRGSTIVGVVSPARQIVFHDRFKYMNAHLKGNYCESLRNL